MFAPRLLLLLAFAALPLAAQPVLPDETETAPKTLPACMAVAGDAEKPAVVVSLEYEGALKKVGWKAQKDGSLARIDGGPEKGLIPVEYLEKAKIKWRDGALFYDGSPYKVEENVLGPVLRGLASFTDAARTPAKEAGIKLAAWGMPPTVDGKRLYNPGGDATYFGVMLHSLLSTKPSQVASLSVQRASQVLDLVDHAYGQAFYKQRADIAQTDLDRAKLLLFGATRAGETPLTPGGAKARPDPTAMLGDYKKQLEADIAAATKAGDEVRRKDSAEALAVLNQLEKQRFHKHLDMTVVPAPGEKPKEEPAAAPDGPGLRGLSAPVLGPEKKKEEPYVELATGLPGVLRALERVGGKPLSLEQQENLIRSFPMGDLVWRMGAQNLWRQGLTGKGVKVAVIDGGVAENPELGSSVKGRVNLTPAVGDAAVSPHGTHVSGIIHALAPEAALRSYVVFQDEPNDRTRENPDAAVIKAIHQAVKDGNHVINMSLGSGDTPGNEMARVVEEYASKGVVFVIAAGNSRNYNGGIDAPSSAPSAITVGALDSSGRMSDFSAFGDRFDPRKLTSVVKEVFLAPGSNIVSTMPPSRGAASIGGGRPDVEYAPMSGTSMATPAMAGVSALLVQEMLPNPVNMAQRLKAAMSGGVEPIALDKLPPEVPIDQPFIVVNPQMALENLKRDSPPVADTRSTPPMVDRIFAPKGRSGKKGN